MTNAEWKAVYDYCKENVLSGYELMNALKSNGTIGREDTLEDLGRYVKHRSYDGMMRFLIENL